MRRGDLARIASAALCFAVLAGCAPRGGTDLGTGSTSAPTTSTAPGTTSPAPAALSGPVFALCPKALNNPYFNLVRAGADAAAEKLKIPRPDWVGATEADAAKQVASINDLISRGVQGIAISPNAPDSVTAAVAKAIQKKIPVICFDADAPKSQRLAYIGTDNYAAGKTAGRAMAEQLAGHGDVLVVTGGLGALNLNERIRGFRDGTAGTKVRVASVQACDDDQARAHQIIQDYLLSHPETAGIFAAGLWAVLPAGQILQQKKRAGQVKVVGFDTLPEELQRVKDGSVQVLVGQRPYEMGRLSVIALNDLRLGKPLKQKIIDTGTDVVTRANVDAFMKGGAKPG